MPAYYNSHKFIALGDKDCYLGLLSLSRYGVIQLRILDFGFWILIPQSAFHIPKLMDFPRYYPFSHHALHATPIGLGKY